MRSRAKWIAQVKSRNCTQCHQLGNRATPEVPPELGDFDSLVDAWARRVQSGQAGGFMNFGIDWLAGVHSRCSRTGPTGF